MEKMKKLLVLLTLMVAVFGFTAGAFSQTICENCKCPLRNISCTTASGQGAVAVCNEFDFDRNNALDGYCTFSALNNCRLIFEICNCAAASSFTPGLAVGVKMTVLVNGQAGDRGAYWSGTTAPAAITFQDATTWALACAIVPPLARSFGAPSYYLSDGVTAAVPLAGVGCTYAAANKATILTTPAPGFVILAGMGSYWQIDVPPIRIDPAVLHNGEVISVRVEMYDPTAPTPICPVCVSCLCQCEIPVATVCCTIPAPSTTLTFNYFTSLTAGDYWNGIAIANSGAAAGSCVLSATEQDGSKGTATVAVPAGGMFVDLLENITFTGTGLGGVPCFISAKCNWAGAIGFGMMANGSGASMGYKVP
jgi:hypothetical protein